MAKSINRILAETEFYKTYNYNGTLVVNTGSKRFYMPINCTMTDIEAYVATAPTGAALQLAILKNGSSVATTSISAGSTSSSNTSNSIDLETGDYITINITQVGSGTAGEDLYLNLKFSKR